MQDDTELLRRYAEERSESAFTELVNRHFNLVYSAAYRQAGGDAHLAQDIAQKVFTALARKAGPLSRYRTLAAWLFRATYYTAIDARREKQRRLAKYQEAESMHAALSDSEPPVDWERLRPVLDEVVNELSERDRQAVLARYFEGLSFAEVGARLNLEKNAARMRVERALEKLRELLAKRGFTSTAVALEAVLTSHAVAAAPGGMAANVSGAALAAAASGGGASAVLTFLAMNKLPIAITSVVVVGFAATAFYGLPSKENSAPVRAENVSAPPVAAVAQKTAASDSVSALTDRVHDRQTKAKAKLEIDLNVPYRNAGQATPLDAMMTFFWASDCGDIDALAKVIVFYGHGREKAAAILARLPESVRAQYPTPERLYALFIAADALNYGPPPADLIKYATVLQESADQVFIGGPGATLENKGSGQKYQNTPDGWKYIFPEEAVEKFANQFLKDSPSNPAPKPASTGAQ